jgi:hypothetical protein
MKPFGLDGTQQEPQPKEIMDWKKFFVAFVAAFGFIFVFGFLWYGKLMHGVHQEVPALWRPEAEFGNHFSWLVFGHIVMAFFLTLLCSKFVPAGGPPSALGILVALVYVGNDFIMACAADNDENSLRLDCGRPDYVRRCRRNHWHDL